MRGMTLTSYLVASTAEQVPTHSMLWRETCFFPQYEIHWKRLKQKTSLPCSRGLYSRNKCGGGRIILSFCSLAIKINSIHQIWRMEKQKHSCSVLKPVLCIWECLWKHGSTAVENVYVELQLRGKRISCLLEAQFQLINCALGKRLCEKFSETRILFWGLGQQS